MENATGLRVGQTHTKLLRLIALPLPGWVFVLLQLGNAFVWPKHGDHALRDNTGLKVECILEMVFKFMILGS